MRAYIPEFNGDGKDEVFVHHLLTHTSGIEGFPDIPELMSELTRRMEQPPRDPGLHPAVDAFLQFAYERPLRKPPGEEMFYDNLNYDLLGEIVRRVSGQPFQDFVQDRIYDPLGMADSYVTVPVEVRNRVVAGDRRESDGRDVGLANVQLGLRQRRRLLLDGAQHGRVRSGVPATARGAGVPRILGPATMREMITNQIPGVPGDLLGERHDEASWGYGWGIACAEKWAYFPAHPPGTFQHGGSSGVYLWCDPTNDVVGAFFAAATKEIAPEHFLWQADLFVNVVTAAIED